MLFELLLVGCRNGPDACVGKGGASAPTRLTGVVVFVGWVGESAERGLTTAAAVLLQVDLGI
jgi:hypothetical protein